MGLYRVVLESKNCSLRMEQFNEQLYKYELYLNCYSQLYTGATCKWLDVANGTITTDSGSIYAKLPNFTYEETALVVDDTGAIQL
jgi:hypothetical protein